MAPEHDAKIFKEFRHLCGETGLLPTSHVIAESSIKTTERPVASGGFCDMWKGIHNDERVAIKSIRVHKHDDIKRAAKVADYHHKIFCKEVVMWRRISHPNIVPFLGVSTTPVPLSMVSEWMPNGNVRDYVGENPDTSRLQLVRRFFNLSWLRTDETSVTRSLSRFVVLALPRDRAWRFERGTSLFLSLRGRSR